MRLPFRTVLCFCAFAGLLAAADAKDFVNPNPLGTVTATGEAAPWVGKFDFRPAILIYPPEAIPKLPTASKQCSIPLKWANIGKSNPDPRGEKWIGPHPERLDAIYGPNPAPACVDLDTNLNPAKIKPPYQR